MPPDDDEEDAECEEPAATPTAAEALRGEGLPPRHVDHYVIGVLPWNTLTVDVFRECQPTVIAGIGGSVRLGISAQELRTAMQLLHVPTWRRDEIREGVRVMDEAARHAWNDRVAQADDRGKPHGGTAATPGQ